MCPLKTQTVKKEQVPSDQTTGLQVFRSREPNHFLLKVESFSESKEEKYECDEFEAGGYKWRLIFYPNGDKKRNGSNHISLYLSISDTTNLPQGVVVEADFSLFLYNHISEQYLTHKLTNATRFNLVKMESGFSQFIALDHFKETSNGYLYDDNCVLGAEVSVISTSFTPKIQKLSMNIKKINSNIFTWRVNQFSSKNGDYLSSYNFEYGGLQWQLTLCPKGHGDGIGKYIAIFLHLARGESSKHPANRKVYAEYKIRIMAQISNNHIERLANHWFGSSTSWGYDDFMELSDVNDKSKGRNSDMFPSKTQTVTKEQDQTTGLQVFRSREPSHFLLKVKAFSESNEERYESEEFEAGGYKWRLIFYPNGDKKQNGSNHISRYLSISDTKKLLQGLVVEANFSLFLYNHKSEQYLTRKLTNATRFNWVKMESGFSQFIALDHFKETSNGYLYDDNCVLGAEVSVISTSITSKIQKLSMNIKKINSNIFIWKVDQFSSKKESTLLFYDFEYGGLQWRLTLYPKGHGDGKDKYISVFLHLAAGESSKHPSNSKAYAEYKIRIRNQVNSNHIERLAYWFSNISYSWGYSEFMELSDVNDKSKGYLVNDTLLVEIEFNVPIKTKT